MNLSVRSLRNAAAGLLLVAAMALAAACRGDGDSPSPTSTTAAPTAASAAARLDGELTVFAAASLTAAFKDVGAAFEDANSGVDVTFNFAGSPALRTQVEEGAPADVLALADNKNMQAALDKKLVAQAWRTFARNRLVIAVPSANPGEISAPVDLANGGLKLVLAQEDVPVGNYARESLGNMEADATFGAGFRDRVLANVVSNEPNVKAVVTKVQLGEADAGIVYATDITGDLKGTVTAIPIPDEFNVVATYPVSVVSDAKEPEIAAAFIDFLLSAAGQAILEEHGFTGAE